MRALGAGEGTPIVTIVIARRDRQRRASRAHRRRNRRVGAHRDERAARGPDARSRPPHQQLAAIAERVPDYRDFGDRVWVRIDEDQAARFAAQGISVQLFPDAELVVLPAVVFRPPDENPQPPDGLAATPPSGDDTSYAVVLFAGTPQREWINATRDLGAALVEDLDGQAAVFRMSADGREPSRRQPFVAWWGWYHPGYAISYLLCGRDDPYGAADFRTLAVDPAQLAGAHAGVWFFDDADFAAGKTAVAAAGAQIVADLGEQLVVDAPATSIAAIARVPGVRSIEPARSTNVTNMRAGVITGVNQVRERGPVSASLPVELDGAGETVGVLDSGLGSGTLGAVHLDYNARVILIANVWDPVPTPPPPGPPPVPTITCQDFQTHGTHVVGTIAGDGSQSAGFAPALIAAPPNGAPAFTPPASLPRGVAPAAQIVFHSGNQHPPPPAAVGANGPYAPQTDLLFTAFLRAFRTAHAWGARVHSNSWEYGGGHNNYTANSRSVDTFAWFNPEDVVVFATGNNEGDRNADGILDANSMGDTAVAKNILAVGASENVTRIDGVPITYRAWYGGRYTNAAFNAMAGNPPNPFDFGTSDNANEVALFSNRGRVKGAGPAASRRIRPDIVAPGTNIVSTAPAWPWPSHELAPGFAAAPAVPNQPRWDLVVNSAPQQLYYVFSGTSMAAPHVAGACLLTRQFYRVCYGQLRRPVRVSTETALLDRPAIAPHRDGCVVAWLRAGASNDVHAVRLATATLLPVGADVPLQTNAGATPAIALRAPSGQHGAAAPRRRQRVAPEPVRPAAGPGRRVRDERRRDARAVLAHRARAPSGGLRARRRDRGGVGADGHRQPALPALPRRRRARGRRRPAGAGPRALGLGGTVRGAQRHALRDRVGGLERGDQRRADAFRRERGNALEPERGRHASGRARHAAPGVGRAHRALSRHVGLRPPPSRRRRRDDAAGRRGRSGDRRGAGGVGRPGRRRTDAAGARALSAPGSGLHADLGRQLARHVRRVLRAARKRRAPGRAHRQQPPAALRRARQHARLLHARHARCDRAGVARHRLGRPAGRAGSRRAQPHGSGRVPDRARPERAAARQRPLGAARAARPRRSRPDGGGRDVGRRRLVPAAHASRVRVRQPARPRAHQRRRSGRRRVRRQRRARHRQQPVLRSDRLAVHRRQPHRGLAPGPVREGHAVRRERQCGRRVRNERRHRPERRRPQGRVSRALAPRRGRDVRGDRRLRAVRRGRRDPELQGVRPPRRDRPDGSRSGQPRRRHRAPRLVPPRSDRRAGPLHRGVAPDRRREHRPASQALHARSGRAARTCTSAC